MKRLKSFLFAAALAAVLTGGATARADINWHADWTPSNNFIPAGLSSTINFSNLANAGFTTTSSLPVISTPASNLSISTTVVGADTFSNQGYALSLKLTDDASGSFHIFNFSGKLSGVITMAGASVSNVFDAPTTLSSLIGNNNYTVTLNGFVAPGSGHNINTVGGIGADITAVAGDDNGQPHGTPEPSTLALGGLGMVFTGLMAWRRRNRNAALAS